MIRIQILETEKITLQKINVLKIQEKYGNDGRFIIIKHLRVFLSLAVIEDKPLYLNGIIFFNLLFDAVIDVESMVLSAIDVVLETISSLDGLLKHTNCKVMQFVRTEIVQANLEYVNNVKLLRIS